MIEFCNVNMTYDTGIHALKNVSFKVEDGEFLFVIGRSGSGKSTLIKLLTCEENPSGGKVLIDGYEISFLKRSLIPYLRRNIGMVFQDFRLIYSKTVYENVAFAMEIIGASPKLIKRRVPIVLSTVGLRDKASMRPNQLSGGEQQRVAIARAMVNNPMLILADEPTGNLDPVNSEAIMALLEEINASGTTVIVCTHDSSIVNKMRRRVMEISDGYLVQDTVGGEYNLQIAPDAGQKRRKAKNTNQPASDRAPDNSEKPRIHAAPFVRNINIKFSTDETVPGTDDATITPDPENEGAKTSIAEEEALKAISDYYRRKSQDYHNPSEKITGNPEPEHPVAVTAAESCRSVPAEANEEVVAETDEAVPVETDEALPVETDEEAVAEVIEENAAENVTDQPETVDFRVLIRPKRVSSDRNENNE